MAGNARDTTYMEYAAGFHAHESSEYIFYFCRFNIDIKLI